MNLHLKQIKEKKQHHVTKSDEIEKKIVDKEKPEKRYDFKISDLLQPNGIKFKKDIVDKKKEQYRKQ